MEMRNRNAGWERESGRFHAVFISSFLLLFSFFFFSCFCPFSYFFFSSILISKRDNSVSTH